MSDRNEDYTTLFSQVCHACYLKQCIHFLAVEMGSKNWVWGDGWDNSWVSLVQTPKKPIWSKEEVYLELAGLLYHCGHSAVLSKIWYPGNKVLVRSSITFAPNQGKFDSAIRAAMFSLLSIKHSKPLRNQTHGCPGQLLHSSWDLAGQQHVFPANHRPARYTLSVEAKWVETKKSPLTAKRLLEGFKPRRCSWIKVAISAMPPRPRFGKTFEFRGWVIPRKYRWRTKW